MGDVDLPESWRLVCLFEWTGLVESCGEEVVIDQLLDEVHRDSKECVAEDGAYQDGPSGDGTERELLLVLHLVLVGAVKSVKSPRAL